MLYTQKIVLLVTIYPFRLSHSPYIRRAGPFELPKYEPYFSAFRFCTHQVSHREAIVGKALRLPPEGIHGRNRMWNFHEGALLSEYEWFLKKLFARTVPTPISGCVWP